MNRKDLFIASLFLASVIVLGLKLFNPTRIQIIVEGSNINVAELSGFFTYRDLIVFVFSPILIGFCSAYFNLRRKSMC